MRSIVNWVRKVFLRDLPPSLHDPALVDAKRRITYLEVQASIRRAGGNHSWK